MFSFALYYESPTAKTGEREEKEKNQKKRKGKKREDKKRKEKKRETEPKAKHFDFEEEASREKDE